MSATLRRIALTSVLLAGCGWKSDGLARLEELYPTPPPVDAGPVVPFDIGTPKCNGFAGRWAVRLTENGTIAPLGEPWKMVITDLFIADSTDQQFQFRFCDQQVSITTSSGSTDLGKTKVPDSLKSVLNSRAVTIPLPGDGTFAASNIVWLWGLSSLAQPLTDPLPTKDNYVGDARVVDQDMDTHPGVTLNILVPAGDRYMVRRAIWNFAPGKLTLDNQWITGALTAAINESALDASNMLLLTAAPITGKTDGTFYELRCVGSSYTCPALAADHPELFSGAPK